MIEPTNAAGSLLRMKAADTTPNRRDPCCSTQEHTMAHDMSPDNDNISADQPLDPDQGAPEGSGSADIPASPAELIALRNQANKPRPEKPERQSSAKVLQVMELIDQLDTDPGEDLDIAFRLVRRLETFHDGVVEELRDDADASHNQLISWAIDADRLMQARILLGNVDLE